MKSAEGVWLPRRLGWIEFAGLEIEPQTKLHAAEAALGRQGCAISAQCAVGEAGSKAAGVEAVGVGYVKDLAIELQGAELTDLPNLAQRVVDVKVAVAAQIVPHT